MITLRCERYLRTVPQACQAAPPKVCCAKSTVPGACPATTMQSPHALNRLGFVSDTPQNRADDLHRMFGDPEVKAIVAAIGGDHSCHLLPLLDFDLIWHNPKVFMGFSDITVLNVAIWKETGLVTFNGPAPPFDKKRFRAHNIAIARPTP